MSDMQPEHQRGEAWEPAVKAHAIGYMLIHGPKRTSIDLGIPKTTLVDWSRSPEATELRRKAGEELLGEVFAGVQLGLESVVGGLRKGDANLRDASLAFGILTDKWVLLSGGATSRTEHIRRDGTAPPRLLTDEDAEQLRAYLASSDAPALDIGSDES